jgi:magnesium-transporting ATPase (P-type)
VRGAVFGRMSPDQKQQLVETLQTLGYISDILNYYNQINSI